MYLKRHGKTHNITKIALLQHVRGSKQQHLKAFREAGVQFMVHHIGHPVAADHKPAVQIVHSAKRLGPCRAHAVYPKPVLHKQISDAFGVLGLWQNHYDVKHTLTPFPHMKHMLFYSDCPTAH